MWHIHALAQEKCKEGRFNVLKGVGGNNKGLECHAEVYSVSWQSHRFMSKGMRFLPQKTGENTKSLERVNLRQDDT